MPPGLLLWMQGECQDEILHALEQHCTSKPMRMCVCSQQSMHADYTTCHQTSLPHMRLQTQYALITLRGSSGC